MKRVTVTIELVDHAGRTTWATTETATASTGDNPRFHVRDFALALDEASHYAIGIVRSRFGEPPTEDDLRIPPPDMSAPATFTISARDLGPVDE